MMLATPEFIEAERIDLLDEIEVAAELQHRMLADRVMRGKEGSEFQACHWASLQTLLFLDNLAPNYGVGRAKAIAEGALWPMQHGAMRAADGSPEVSGYRLRRWFRKIERPPRACATAPPSPRPAEQRTTDRSAAAPVPRASPDIARNRRRANRFPAICRAGDGAAARHPAIPSSRAG